MKKRIVSALLVIAVALVSLNSAAFYASASSGAVIVAYGDSIAAAGKWQTEFTRLSGESVINSGVGGDTSADGLARFASAVSANDPDVVFIAFGTNDASKDMDRYVPIENYKENLREMVRRVRALGARAVIVTPPPVVDAQYLTRHDAAPFEEYGGPNGLVSLYAQAARDVAAEFGADVADVNAAFSGLDFASLIADGVHPNDSGYALYGQTAYQAYTGTVAGDLNYDGVLDKEDVKLIRRAILGKYVLSDAQRESADMNGDGNADYADYELMKTGSGWEDMAPSSAFDGFTVTADLTAGSQDEEVMAANTAELQRCVDAAHDAGGGTVVIQKGTFYFSTQGVNARGWENFVCFPRDNVTVEGQCIYTVLMPVGQTPGGLDMFYFNEYADSGFKNPLYLVNADFKNFVIDGGLAHSDRYTSAGKGFMINLYKNCDYDNVIVMNTDGTGFGMDCPINCTIRNCEAFGCGKAATTASAGASGIGMGTGYCEQENMIIENCYCEGNMKFGIFFEHQGRFNPSYYPAQKLGRMLVVNCSARNNYIDFGCELGVDVVYRCCDVYADSTAHTKLAFNHHTIRCRFEYMDVKARFDDVTDSSIYYYEPVYWAVNKGITTGVGGNTFGINANCTVGQAVTFLYRLAGLPGALKLVNHAESTYYEDSLEWAQTNGIVDNGTDPNAVCTRAAFIDMMWRYSGSPVVEGQYDSATNWALNVGIMNTVIDSDILRRDAVTILYRYFSPFDKYNSNDAIGLLRHVLFPNDYPLMFRSGDFDKNGVTDSRDAVYLLRHVLYPEDYPID